MSKKVSVIIPLYNLDGDKDLSIKAINSVIDQSYKNWELIIIDDHSTDGTYEHVSNYLKQIDIGNKIKLIRNDRNNGCYITMNIGINMATGNYITRLDGDDYYDNDKLKIQVGLLKNPKIICAFCSYKNNINGIQKYAEVTAMYKKELFRKIGYFDSVRFAADSEFKERIRKIYCRSRIKISSEVLYHVFRRNNSLTKSKISNIKSETRKNYKKNYLNWHSTANKLYIPYPLIKRPFVVDKLML